MMKIISSCCPTMNYLSFWDIYNESTIQEHKRKAAEFDPSIIAQQHEVTKSFVAKVPTLAFVRYFRTAKPSQR